MRHMKSGRKLSRNPAHRKALLRNLTTSLIRYEKIETTVEKAKELRIMAERTITAAKRGGTNAHENVFKTIKDKEVVKKLFNNIVGRVANRNGGYTRIVRVGSRSGDCADMAIIELVDEAPVADSDNKKTKKDSGKVKAKDKEAKEPASKSKAKTKTKTKTKEKEAA